jgi:hypothetical protein
VSQNVGNRHVAIKVRTEKLVTHIELQPNKLTIMEKLNLDPTTDIFKKFTLSNEEMINVRGGESEPIIKPNIPPIKL